MNILIVEDDQDLSYLMELLLSDFDYKVKTISSIEDAYFHLDNIDLVIVDSFDNKEFSFVNFCKTKNIYSIYHTGRMNITDQEHYLFDYVVTKPGFKFLVQCVNELSNKFQTCI